MNDIVRHLELIQGVISRMAQTSFILKGWTITVGVGVLGFAAHTSNWWLGLFSVFTSLVFWGLDAYYLRQERLFRCLYEKVRAPSTESIIPSFSMDTTPCKRDVPHWRNTILAPTIRYLHGVVLVVAIIVSILIYLNTRG